MGDPVSVPASESTQSVLDSYTRNIPGLINATANQQTNVANAQLAATQATQPGYNALNLQQAQQYGLPLAQVGQDIQRSNALAGGATNLASIQGPGGASARAAEQLARDTNPNYYKAMDASANQSKALLDSFNLNGLSAGEYNATERAVNQGNSATGNLGNNSATNTVANAMNFGNEFANKQGRLANAIGAANNTANTAQNTGFSPINIALGQPNTSTMGNFGTGTFNGTNASTQNASGSNAFGFGSSSLGSMVGSNNALIGANTQLAQSGDPFNMAMQGLGGTASAISGVFGGGKNAACCFIMMESYHGMMPSYIRKCRDKYYFAIPQVATGYKKMAEWLVPAMRNSFIVRSLVWHLMVKPLSNWGAFITRKSHEKKGKLARRFWFTVWNHLGK